jgi:hypothetical protein
LAVESLPTRQPISFGTTSSHFATSSSVVQEHLLGAITKR